MCDPDGVLTGNASEQLRGETGLKDCPDGRRMAPLSEINKAPMKKIAMALECIRVAQGGEYVLIADRADLSAHPTRNWNLSDDRAEAVKEILGSPEQLDDLLGSRTAELSGFPLRAVPLGEGSAAHDADPGLASNRRATFYYFTARDDAARLKIVQDGIGGIETDRTDASAPLRNTRVENQRSGDELRRDRRLGAGQVYQQRAGG